MARVDTAANETQLAAPRCDCGVEMELFIAGTRRTGGFFSPRVEYRLFTCPRCGDGCRYERTDDDWERL